VSDRSAARSGIDANDSLVKKRPKVEAKSRGGRKERLQSRKHEVEKGIAYSDLCTGIRTRNRRVAEDVPSGR
jgi:hypothetical protein